MARQVAEVGGQSGVTRPTFEREVQKPGRQIAQVARSGRRELEKFREITFEFGLESGKGPRNRRAQCLAQRASNQLSIHEEAREIPSQGSCIELAHSVTRKPGGDAVRIVDGDFTTQGELGQSRLK